MDLIERMRARLRDGDDLAETLAAGFDAFEVIRVAARACEDRAPELLAAFMLAAGAAAEGRNALLAGLLVKCFFSSRSGCRIPVRRCTASFSALRRRDSPGSVRSGLVFRFGSG